VQHELQISSERVIVAEERSYTDGVNGETTYTYHARIQNLRPGKTYGADPVNPTTGVKGKPSDNYTVFETFTLVRPRSDGDFGWN